MLGSRQLGRFWGKLRGVDGERVTTAALTRATVVDAFLAVLGRLPESEAVIRAHRNLQDNATLIAVLRRSREYALRFGASAPPDEHLIKATGRASMSDVGAVAGGPRILLYGNCQATPIAALMQAMSGIAMPTVVPTTGAMLAKMGAGVTRMFDAVQRCDVVFVQGMQDVASRIAELLPAHTSKLRLLPSVNFSGFHPDIVYVGSKPGGQPVKGPLSEYHSAIALAGWRGGLSVSDTVGLFREEVFAELGYFDHWSLSRKNLEDAFAWSGMALSDFFPSWTAGGCWMYSVNHPKLRVLADVTRAALRREGFSPLAGAEDFVQDGLAKDAVWPVYPDIGAAVGVAGSYVFKCPGASRLPDRPVLTIGLEQMVASAFACFDDLGRGKLVCERLDAPRFQNLGRFVRGRVSAATVGTPSKALLASTPQAAASANPYQGLPDERFWRRAVAGCPPGELDPVLEAGFKLRRTDRVATAGSCFAQHISNTLRRQGFRFLDSETAAGMAPEEAARRQFGLFSARYGNLYTARQLLQLFERSQGSFAPLDRHWQRGDGRWVDPLRPQVEPDGYASPAQVWAASEVHLAAVRAMFAELDVLVFTLGLTEAWRNRVDGTVCPLAPGVAAGHFDSELHEFINFDVDAICVDLHSLVRKLRAINPSARLILTVSPVPLIATYMPRHVLVSNTSSKSTLRVAAERTATDLPGVDYFPSFEIITGSSAGQRYFEDDLRSVTAAGVQHVMRLFLRHYAPDHVLDGAEFNAEAARVGNVFCDEEALDRR